MIFSNQIVEAIGWTVVHSLWQGAIIAFLLWIVFSFIKTQKANTRYLIANVALLTQILVSIFTFGRFHQVSNSPIGWSGITKLNPTAVLIQESSFLDSITYFFTQNMDTIVLLWILGVSLFSIKMLLGYSYIFYIRNRYLSPVNQVILNTVKTITNQLNITKKIFVYESELIQSPIVTGWIKPLILFPIGLINQLSSSGIEAIIAHELAHISRHDILFNFLQSLSEIIYYYHPGIWWISNQIRKEREHSCDDIALQLTGNQINYAKALLQVQNYAQTPQFALGFAGNKGQLLTRIQRILSPNETKNRLFEKIVLSIIIFGALLTMSFKEYSETKIDSLLDESTITVTSDKHETFLINVDSLPNKKNILQVSENNPKLEVEIEDGSIKKLEINGTQIAKKEYPKLESAVEQYWNTDEDSIQVFVVDKDTIIMNGEDLVVVQNENHPVITIKKDKTGNDEMQIVLGNEKIDILKAGEKNFSAYKIEKVVDDNQTTWEKQSVEISSKWNIPDTSKSYFVDKIYETDVAWIFQSIENGSIREIVKSATPKIVVKTVDTDGAITNEVMLFDHSGNRTTFYSVNEIGQELIDFDMEEIKLDIEERKEEINQLIKERHLKTIH